MIYRIALCLAVAFSVGLPGRETRAFNPPVDSTGPITARIEGPSIVTSVETPVPLKIRVENSSEGVVEGTVSPRVADRWRVEPAKPVPFKVEGRGTAIVELTLTAGAGTRSCHYPVHAFVEVESGGKKHVAHPILILEARLEDPPPPRAAVEWAPIDVPADGELALWRLPARRVVVQVFDEKPRVLAAGWTGSDERTRADVRAGVFSARGDSREGLSLHPPWHGGRAGTLVVELPLKLPGTKPIRLRFATAIREHRAEQGEPPSDGVAFRVRVLPFDAPVGAMGEALFDRFSGAKSWEDGEADLSAFAGKAIRLQLESHPGPRKDTTCDQSHWAEPVLASGNPVAPPAFPPPGGTPSRLLGTLESGGGRWEVRTWPGRRGLLDGAIGFLRGDKKLFFRGFETRVLGDALEDGRSPGVLIETREEAIEGGLRVRHRFRRPEGTFDLVIALRVDSSALRASLRLENVPASRPWSVAYLEDVAAGPWSERVERVYAGPGNVIEKPDSFQLGFDGHRLSTSFVGFDFANGVSLVQAVDVPPDRLEVDPRAGRFTLRSPHAQTITFIPSRSVWDAVKVWRDANGWKASRGVEKLAGRFVFDLWGGRYGDSARALRRAFRHGLTDAVVVWHNWQRWGYDYRLPDIYPPNPEMGTLDELRGLVETCKQHGVLFAPHDNYIDYYPDAEGFSCEKLVFSREGRPVRAWLNEGRGAQSYRWRPDLVQPFVERNLKLIRDGFAPTAYFIDVWSSIGPHDYWTHDGAFRDRVSTRDSWAAAFAWIRDFLGGDAPQISESGHDQLLGSLDGAQANHLRVGEPPRGEYAWAVWPIRCADSERVPWFDAAHHDRFVLHGAGYDPRYRGGLDAKEHGIYSDDYIATEVLTGHPAMVPAPFGRDVVRKYWLLHDILRGLALRRIDAVELAGGNLHRQHVRWEGGGDVWVNRGRAEWNVDGHTLPPFGFYARVPAPASATAAGGVTESVTEAAIERLGGATVEWARSPSSVYANARPQTGPARPPIYFGGVSTSGACRLHVEDGALRITPLPDGQDFTLSWRWKDLPWKLAGASQAETLDEDGKALRRVPVERDGDRATLTCKGGEFAYRLIRE